MNPPAIGSTRGAGPTLAFFELLSIALVSSCFAVIVVKLVEMVYVRCKERRRRRRVSAQERADANKKNPNLSIKFRNRGKIETRIEYQQESTEAAAPFRADSEGNFETEQNLETNY